MIDVFFCTAAKTKERVSMALACLDRWEREGGINLEIFITNDAVVPRTKLPLNFFVRDDFQRMRRIAAENMAESPIYVVTDDDCLPQAEAFIGEAVRLMSSYPMFGILSLMPSNCCIVSWGPEYYTPLENVDVMEHVDVGGVRFCRKRAMKEWPLLEGNTYDRAHCEALRAGGYRCGYFRNLFMNHLGEGYRTL